MYVNDLNTDHYVPSSNNDFHWNVEPHCPQQDAIYEIWQPAQIEHDIDKEELQSQCSNYFSLLTGELKY